MTMMVLTFFSIYALGEKAPKENIPAASVDAQRNNPAQLIMTLRRKNHWTF